LTTDGVQSDALSSLLVKFHSHPIARGPVQVISTERCAEGQIGPEFVGMLDRKQFGEPGAGPFNPALHGSDLAVADFGGLLVGKPLAADQDDCFALIEQQFR